ncbi:MAG TPA: TetR family transcriptional regulator [Solirubrobacteraceae bacterium]|nr:TetR family transcriptional regulator [Solirubrobacteraceae bacterium]
MGNAAPAASPRPYGALSREELLAAAADCIAERGFDRTRLRDVAKRAGVSIGMLQHHFDTRDALLSEAFRWSCNELIDRWRRRVESTATPWARIEVLIEEQTGDPALLRHCTMWTEFCACSARHVELRDAVAEVFAAWRQLMAAIIEEGIASGDFRPELGIADIVDIFNAAVDGFEMATAVNARLVSPERFRTLVLEVAASLLMPPGPRRPSSAKS